MGRPWTGKQRRALRRGIARAPAAAGWAVGIALLLCHAASAAPPADLGAARAATSTQRESLVWRDVICTSSSCRPSSPWNAAAFAVTVLTVAWLARRHPMASP